MPHIRFDSVSKSFGDTRVIEEFSADIEDKEFLVLLGPSGCGKSTMLRMIAGLADVSGGEILFDGVTVNDLEPKERDVAFVFQSYALYPNMTVRENIAFPLLMQQFRWWYHIPVLATVMRRVLAGRPELKEKVDAVARTLELTPYLDRRPKSLSGGQRQRVALARSLVRNPELYLLDEPLSNLDAKLRGHMRTEITSLYQRVRKTFVYVTHDQVEAMTMATRIIVLREGRIQQIGTPEEIYENPANPFVARFIGSPGMNLLPIDVTAGVLRMGSTVLTHDSAVSDGPHLLGVRPEHVHVDRSNGAVSVRVTSVEQLGGETLLGLAVHGADGGALDDDDASTTYARISADRSWRVGDTCFLDFPSQRVRIFDVAHASPSEPREALR